MIYNVYLTEKETGKTHYKVGYTKYPSPQIRLSAYKGKFAKVVIDEAYHDPNVDWKRLEVKLRRKVTR